MVSIDDVKHLAYLSRIGIDDEDVLRLYAKQINDILEYFAMLDELSVEHEPYRMSMSYMEMRSDEDISMAELDYILVNAKNLKDGFVKAPKMV